MSLNSQQKRVFDASINRNVAVSAGAGTGKSCTLKAKVIELITRKEDPIKPSEFLIVTFTNEATNSLRNSIKKEQSKKPLVITSRIKRLYFTIAVYYKFHLL